VSVSIRFVCPACGKKLETEDRYAGREFDCPRCGAPTIVPAELIREVEDEAPPAPAVRPAAEPAIVAVSAPDVVPERGAAPERGVSSSPSRRVAAAPPRRQKKPAAEAPLARSGRAINFEDLIDMTAMVDIVFFLLIFFLVTSMHALDSTIPVPVPNPESNAGQATAVSADADDSQIVVNIDRHDVIRIEGTEIFNAKDLMFKLKELSSGAGRPDKLLVVGSGDASHGQAIMVIDAGHELKLSSRMAVRDEVE
jgi:biopolymer transport protein ExbD/predicted RNA-binding Zn-ribbon protein involved in translation (DUF1610 family)